MPHRAVALMVLLLVGCAHSVPETMTPRVEGRHWTITVGEEFSRPRITDFVGMTIAFRSEYDQHLTSNMTGDLWIRANESAIVTIETPGTVVFSCLTCPGNATLVVTARERSSLATRDG